MKTIRKGAKVRYIGSNELAKGAIFRVMHKNHNDVEVMFPIRYGNGEVHLDKQYVKIADVELVEE